MTTTQTKIGTCPRCRNRTERSRVYFGGRELAPSVECLCDECGNAQTAEDAWQARWKRQVPPQYRRAKWDMVPPAARARAQAWDGSAPGVGIWGISGQGKTHLAALLVDRHRRNFRWACGADLRSLSLESLTADGEARETAARKLALHRGCDMLVIDDIFESGKVSDHWATWLWGALEYRKSTGRPTIWTAQEGPGQICAFIRASPAIREGTAEAIERRLVEDSVIISL